MLINGFLNSSTDLSNFTDNAQKDTLYNNLGVTTGNFTLNMERINIGHVAGNHTLTLPTIVDKSKQNICVFDFTTTSSSYPSITNTNIKKKNTDLVYIANTGGAQNITGASNTSPIEITLTSHGYLNGDTVLMASVGGNTNANGTYTITKTGTNTFTLNGTTGNHAYTSGGTASVYGVRNRLTCVSCNASDLWEIFVEQYGGILVPFSQPTLSANGTLGSSSFAVLSSGDYSGSYPAYYAFDNNSDSFWAGTNGASTGYLIIYNPLAVKATSITCQNYTSGIPTAGTIYGSNDGSAWTTLGSYTNSNLTDSASWDANISTGNQAFYKYYKFYFSAYNGGSNSAIRQLTLNGIYTQSY